jgi:hypothetical protein
VPLSPITGLEERRAHDATGTAIPVSYLAASGTDASGGPHGCDSARRPIPAARTSRSRSRAG